MVILNLLLSLFCVGVCGYSAYINYLSGNKLWTGISAAFTLWNLYNLSLFF